MSGPFLNRQKRDNGNISFEQQEMQYNLQGDLLTIPSTLIATLIYKLLHLNNKKYYNRLAFNM
ncbi:DUF3949 domain-containing protein [Ferdinandcohnia quinoae]